MLKIVNKFLITLTLIGVTNSVYAENKSHNFTVTPIAKNVYSIIAPSYGLPSPENKGWNSNSHFVVTDKGVLVFDSGSSELIAKNIKLAIKTVTDKPVSWVVNSHSHADHWLGNAEFSDSGAEIMASASAKMIMKQDGPGAIDFFSHITKGATGSTRIMYPTSLLTQREKRNIGGVDVEFIFANDAHSPGDILMWLPKKKIIFVLVYLIYQMLYLKNMLLSIWMMICLYLKT